jgi:prepilin signal peptidase PulO-like enzyme (type II secretory pathway)
MIAAVGAFLGWKVLPLVILLSALVGRVRRSANAGHTRRVGPISGYFGHTSRSRMYPFLGAVVISLVPAIRPF